MEMRSISAAEYCQVLMSSLSQRFCGLSEEKNRERESFVREKRIQELAAFQYR
jgi:hypothetical protein